MHLKTIAVASLLTTAVPAQATWSQLYPALVPPYRREAVMACHEATATTVMLFGGGPTGNLADGWRLQGSVWSTLPGPLPPARLAATMVYDSVRQRLVLFGGTGATGRRQDTWEWNGVTWTNPLLAVMPAARSSHTMAFDPERGVTVLYGGMIDGSPPGNIVGDTWEWNGSSWQQRTPAVSPGPRLGAILAFDAESRQVLLHGGSAPLGTQGSTVPKNDTWTWDGTAWQQRFPATPPPFRFAARAVSDLHRRRVVLQGGGSEAFAWEWDGGEWRIVLQASPADRNGHVMAYDGVNRRVVLHGGGLGGGGTWVDDTWVYRTPLPADVVPFGSGCAGSAGTPVLANVPYQLPWLGDTVTNRVTGIAAGELGAVFVSSFGSTPPIDLTFLGMTGCDLLVPLDILEFALANAGAADWSYAVPVSMALAGVSFGQQAFPLDFAANPFGLSASNGVTGTFGVR